VALLSNLITVQGDQAKLKQSWSRRLMSIYDEEYAGDIYPEEQVAE